VTSTSAEKSPDKGLAAQATKLVVDSVGSVRAKTTGPLLFIARLIIYGLVLFIVGIAAVTLLVILTVTVVNQLLPGEVWTTYLLLGVLFALLGIFLWSKRID
tara:strand:- start:8874 stop:9179 length:306 start_codon:yes stop_codon:yes gene_type:complete